MEYYDFLQSKSQINSNHGFDPVWMPEYLYDFQKSLVEWALRKGRAAIFGDCGLGKTPMELVWAENVCRKTNGNVLLLTPLAVSLQMIREAEKFGIEAKRSNDGTAHRGITITNYEQLHKFDPSDFVACINDESSILKNFDGRRKTEITAFMRKMHYRLLATATAAPNDYIELGTSSEALGYIGHMDMLNKFFKNDTNSIKPTMSRRFEQPGKMFSNEGKWRFKGHAEQHFWRWVCSWARAVRKPSDLGFPDDGFVLPPLTEMEHIVEAATLADGMLFALPAVGLKEQREERRRTIRERCEKVAELVNDTGQPALVWCHLNDEGDLLEELIPDAIQVSGSNSDDEKEERLIGFSDNKFRVLITKAKIAGFGMNWQHCNHETFFPSHSYEQYYQGVRRCWRFGQKRPVHIEVVTTEGELDVLKNLQRKAQQADRMFSNLVAEMNHAISIDRLKQFGDEQRIPAWL